MTIFTHHDSNTGTSFRLAIHAAVAKGSDGRFSALPVASFSYASLLMGETLLAGVDGLRVTVAVGLGGL